MREVERPPGLSSIELFCCHEVLEVLVVCPQLELVFNAFNEVSPLLQGSNNGEHLLVVDLIVAFDRRQGLRHEGDWVPFSVICWDLREDGSAHEVRAVSFDSKWLCRVWRDEDRCRGDTFLQSIEGSSFSSTPAPFCILPGQVEKWSSMFGEALDEPSIEVSESQEGLHFLLIRQGRPILNASNLDRVHCYQVVRDDHPEILDRGLLKLAFVCSKVEFVLLQEFHDSLGDPLMLFEGLCEDENVVQVHHNHPPQ